MTASDVSGDDVDDAWTWPEAVEDDTAEVPPSLVFRTDSPFWLGNFLPPPPKPPYLEDQIPSDGLTTCDLCSWALQHYSPQSKPQISEFSFGFVFSHNLLVTFTIVSILSALLGAVIMIVLINFRNWCSYTGSHRTFFSLGRRRNRQAVNHKNDRSLHLRKAADHCSPSDSSRLQVSWLVPNRNRRRPTAVQLLTTSIKSVPATNHYTVEGEAYTCINEEAVYTEVDRISSPAAYQNSGYALELPNVIDNEAFPSSAPSSAYYSDISTQGGGYEVIGHRTVINPTSISWRTHNLIGLHELQRSTNENPYAIDSESSTSNYI